MADRRVKVILSYHSRTVFVELGAFLPVLGKNDRFSGQSQCSGSWRSQLHHTPQISFAYSRTVRSAENRPAEAVQIKPRLA